MMSMIKLKVMRPLYWAGTARAAGGILSVDVLTASQLIASGRAKLLDPSDLQALLDAENDLLAARHDCMTFRPKAWVTR